MNIFINYYYYSHTCNALLPRTKVSIFCGICLPAPQKNTSVNFDVMTGSTVSDEAVANLDIASKL